jgi:triosephosphate isomerase (TIM)
MRRPLIAGNWKMYKTAPAAVALAREIWAERRAPGEVDVLLAPPATALHAVADVLRGSAILLAAQNMHAQKEGAFTGEISPEMIKDAGCSHVILGHSERRQIFGETDEGVAGKARAAHDNDLVPIICVGETLDERDGSKTEAVVERQVRAALKELTPEEVAESVIAYEPVWAIGTGRTASSAQAQEVHALIRKLVGATHGPAAADAVRILYGGSVKPENAAELLAAPDVDGALVGGAALVAASFLKIVAAARPPAGA